MRCSKRLPLILSVFALPLVIFGLADTKNKGLKDLEFSADLLPWQLHAHGHHHLNKNLHEAYNHQNKKHQKQKKKKQKQKQKQHSKLSKLNKRAAIAAAANAKGFEQVAGFEPERWQLRAHGHHYQLRHQMKKYQQQQKQKKLQKHKQWKTQRQKKMKKREVGEQQRISAADTQQQEPELESHISHGHKYKNHEDEEHDKYDEPDKSGDNEGNGEENKESDADEESEGGDEPDKGGDNEGNDEENKESDADEESAGVDDPDKGGDNEGNSEENKERSDADEESEGGDEPDNVEENKESDTDEKSEGDDSEKHGGKDDGKNGDSEKDGENDKDGKSKDGKDGNGSKDGPKDDAKDGKAPADGKTPADDKISAPVDDKTPALADGKTPIDGNDKNAVPPAAATPAPIVPVQHMGEFLTKCNTPGQIALTFSEGPSEATTQMLEILKESKARVTFFPNATWLDYMQYAGVTRRAYNDGHLIGMTYRLPNDSSKDMTDVQLRADIAKYATKIYDLIGRYPKYVRLHDAGLKDPKLEPTIRDMGFTLVGFNLDEADYKFHTREQAPQIAGIYESTFAKQYDAF
ncbi:hypothetical protein BGZ65_001855, partial [Modicella reniformis]